MFRNGMDNEVFRKKVAEIKRPKTMNELCDVKVDDQVLSLLKHHTKNFDSRLKNIQTAVMKAGCCLTQLVDSIQNNADAGGDKVDEWTTLGMTSLALLGHGFHNLCLRRRELQRLDLNKRFDNIFEPDVIHNEYLYGGDKNIEKMIKDKSSAPKLYGNCPFKFGQQNTYYQTNRGGDFANSRRGYYNNNYSQHQFSRGGGPMRRGRGYGGGSAPYPPRGHMMSRHGRGAARAARPGELLFHQKER